MQMFVGSFGGDFNQFQTDVVAAFDQFKASGVSRLLIDLTNNGGELEFMYYGPLDSSMLSIRRIRLLGTVPPPVFGWCKVWLPVRLHQWDTCH